MGVPSTRAGLARTDAHEGFVQTVAAPVPIPPHDVGILVAVRLTALLCRDAPLLDAGDDAEPSIQTRLVLQIAPCGTLILLIESDTSPHVVMLNVRPFLLGAVCTIAEVGTASSTTVEGVAGRVPRVPPEVVPVRR